MALRELEPVIIVNIHFTQEKKPLADDINEIKALAVTAGADPVFVLSGNRHAPHAKYFVGSGKAEELKALTIQFNVKLVIVNHDLTPTQERNLERLCACRILDRTGLILDIFAQRARTYEGKLQVELAQLEYLSTRLVRGWTHLERQRGGIGLRGPGETQLETDRRLIGNRVKMIKQRLKKVRQQREQSRRARKKQGIPVVALVGYTNAGKSTLFNLLTEAKVLAEDKLFATLDPTLRRIHIPYAEPVILVDTVGFIQNLPHDLIESFKATLEEASTADLLLHITDISDVHWREKMDEVEHVLTEIGANTVAQIQIFNKIDTLPEVKPRVEFNRETGNPRVWLSAEKKQGIDSLLEAIREVLFGRLQEKQFTLSPQQAALRHEWHEKDWVVSEEIDEQGQWHLTLLVAESLMPDFT